MILKIQMDQILEGNESLRTLLQNVREPLRAMARDAAARGIRAEDLMKALEIEVLAAMRSAKSTRPKQRAGGTAADQDKVLKALTSTLKYPGELLPIRKLRAGLPSLSKEKFDEAVLALSKRWKVILHHHDHPQSLPQDQRDQLVVDNNGTYYVGIALGKL